MNEHYKDEEMFDSAIERWKGIAFEGKNERATHCSFCPRFQIVRIGVLTTCPKCPIFLLSNGISCFVEKHPYNRFVHHASEKRTIKDALNKFEAARAAIQLYELCVEAKKRFFIPIPKHEWKPGDVGSHPTEPNMERFLYGGYPIKEVIHKSEIKNIYKSGIGFYLCSKSINWLDQCTFLHRSKDFGLYEKVL